MARADTCAPWNPRGAGAPPGPGGPPSGQDGLVSARTRRIVIAAGGTAGHVVPALAVAAALQADGAEVEFIGGERAEAALVPAAGFALHRIAVQGLSRTHPLRAL